MPVNELMVLLLQYWSPLSLSHLFTFGTRVSFESRESWRTL